MRRRWRMRRSDPASDRAEQQDERDGEEDPGEARTDHRTAAKRGAGVIQDAAPRSVVSTAPASVDAAPPLRYSAGSCGQGVCGVVPSGSHGLKMFEPSQAPSTRPSAHARRRARTPRTLSGVLFSERVDLRGVS